MTTSPSCICHGTGELVALGSGRYLDLSAWNGDSGDLVDCDCKGEPMTTDQTALRERLIDVLAKSMSQRGIRIYHLDEIADSILADLWELGQQPHLEPTLRERISEAIKLFAYAAVYDIDKYQKRHRQAMALIDQAIAPAAQPLPTRGQIYTAWNEKPEAVGDDEHAYVCDLIAAGFAREDEPEPPVVEWDEDAEWSKTCDLMRMAVADPFTSKRQDNEAVERILADFDARKALAKAVAERGGLPKTQPPSEPTIVKRGAL